MSTPLCPKQLAARNGYTDENYFVWLKAWLTEPRQVQAWADYLEGRNTPRISPINKAALINSTLEALKSEAGKEHRELASHSKLMQKGVEARFAVQFIWGCQTKSWLWKGWTDYEKMASIAVDVLECLEHAFSDGEIMTSVLARVMLRAAFVQNVNLAGFPGRWDVVDYSLQSSTSPPETSYFKLGPR